MDVTCVRGGALHIMDATYDCTICMHSRVRAAASKASESASLNFLARLLGGFLGRGRRVACPRVACPRAFADGGDLSNRRARDRFQGSVAAGVCADAGGWRPKRTRGAVAGIACVGRAGHACERSRRDLQAPGCVRGGGGSPLFGSCSTRCPRRKGGSGMRVGTRLAATASGRGRACRFAFAERKLLASIFIR